MSFSALAADKKIDTCGLHCPLPILRAKKALAEMQSGQILEVKATDPSARLDFAAFAKQTGNTLIKTAVKDKTFIFWMRRR